MLFKDLHGFIRLVNQNTHLTAKAINGNLYSLHFIVFANN